MFLPEDEEKMLREEHGYNDKEIEMVVEANRLIKSGETLRAMAAQDAYKRNHPQGPPAAEETPSSS